MTLPVAGEGAGLDARVWSQILARYRKPSAPRGIVEILITAVPLVAAVDRHFDYKAERQDRSARHKPVVD